MLYPLITCAHPLPSGIRPESSAQTEPSPEPEKRRAFRLITPFRYSTRTLRFHATVSVSAQTVGSRRPEQTASRWPTSPHWAPAVTGRFRIRGTWGARPCLPASSGARLAEPGPLGPQGSGTPSRLFLTRRLWQQPQYRLNGAGQPVININKPNNPISPQSGEAFISLPQHRGYCQDAAGSQALPGGAEVPGGAAVGVREEGASSQPGAGHPGARHWGVVKDGKWNTPPEPTKALCALKKKKVSYTIADKRQTRESRVLGENTRENKGRPPPSPTEDTPERGRGPQPLAPLEGPWSLGALP